MIQIVISFLVLSLFLGCKEHDRIDDAISTKEYVIENNNTQNFANVDSFFSELILIPISASVADSIGGASNRSEFFLVDSLLFFVSRFPEVYIGAVNLQGDFKWINRSDKESPFRFSNIRYADIDTAAHNLVLYDDTKQTFFYYDYAGKLIRQERLPLDFSDRVTISPENTLYDVSNYASPNSIAEGYRFELELHSGDRVDTWKTSVIKRSANHVAFNDNETFFQGAGQAYYRYNFSDTVFQVSDTGLTLAYTLRFQQGGSAQEIIDDPNSGNDYATIFYNNIPHVHRCIVKDNFLYAIYEYDQQRRFVIVAPDNKQVVNTDRLEWNGVVLPQPWIYWNEYFFLGIADFTFDHLQTLRKYNYEMPDSAIHAYQEIEAAHGDRSGGYFAILRIKTPQDWH